MRPIRLVVLLAFAGVVAGTATSAPPTVSFGARAAGPGNTVSVRVAGIRPGRARLMLNPGAVPVDPVFRVSRRGTARFRATIPNVRPGEYRLSVVRNRRTLARSPRPLRVVEPTPGARGCESSVYGTLGPDWERGSLRAGPVAFVGVARGVAAHVIGRPTKVLLVLDNGSVATVRVADADRAHVALLYTTRGGLGSFNRARRVANGLPAVRFRACEASDWRPHTQFNGGFIADRHLCAHLEVHVTGRAEPIPVALSLGAPC
jgi:hypothetical protein